MDTLGTALTKYWHLGDDVMRMSRRLPVDGPVHKAMDDVSCCARRPAWPMNWWIASACPRHAAARHWTW